MIFDRGFGMVRASVKAPKKEAKVELRILYSRTFAVIILSLGVTGTFCGCEELAT